jgi:hypothetical protein
VPFKTPMTPEQRARCNAASAKNKKSEKGRARRLAWQHANREKLKLQHRRYIKSPKGVAKQREISRRPKSRLSSLKANAKRRNMECTLTVEQYATLVASGVCIYCGGGIPETGGLDRKDSTVGYTFENCVPCCRRCNEVRGHDNITYLEMFEVIKLLRTLRPLPHAQTIH